MPFRSNHSYRTVENRKILALTDENKFCLCGTDGKYRERRKSMKVASDPKMLFSVAVELFNWVMIWRGLDRYAQQIVYLQQNEAEHKNRRLSVPSTTTPRILCPHRIWIKLVGMYRTLKIKY